MWFPLHDAVIGFGLEAKVKNNVTRRRYSPVLDHTAVLRFAEVDGAQPYCDQNVLLTHNRSYGGGAFGRDRLNPTQFPASV